MRYRYSPKYGSSFDLSGLLANFGSLFEKKQDKAERRGAGVVEQARLESVCTFTGTGGSNPPLSAQMSGLADGRRRIMGKGGRSYPWTGGRHWEP